MLLKYKCQFIKIKYNFELSVPVVLALFQVLNRLVRAVQEVLLDRTAQSLYTDV